MLLNLFKISKIRDMLKVVAIFFTTLVCLESCSTESPEISNSPGLSAFDIIPKPVLIKPETGYFKLTTDTRIISARGDDEINNIAEILAQRLSDAGINLNVNNSLTQKRNVIQLNLNSEADNNLGNEGYILEVKSSGITISANKPAGIFYGVQSLIQLIPAEIRSDSGAGEINLNIPCVHITDYPRFVWRGLLLDVAHHFLENESIMKYIDQMAKYKYNKMQLHLTNDNAWRIEIKEYPRLTEIGAWRVPRTGAYGHFEKPQPGEKATDGGFYTQEEIKQLVKYAQERYVTIVPGIEIPGHALALISSYPSVSCTGLQYQVNPGSPRGKDVTYAVCVGKESNFEMLDKILTEYTELFPSEYIHIGGDEVAKDYWKRCPKCQKRMRDENLKDVDELQSYFIKRIEKILISKGKKLIGWDEILEGGLAPEATVMSWRSMQGGIEAAQMNHHVVMAPKQYVYFDYRQTDPNIVTGQRPGGLLRLTRVYEFEPVPDNVDEQYILGGEGCLWSERIPTLRQNEYMTWPRGMALSEVLWSPKAERDPDEFILRVEKQFPRFDRDQVNYSKGIYDPIIVPVKDANGVMQISFTSEVKGLDIYYTFDYTPPDNFSNKFNQQPVEIPKGATQINAISYRNGKPIGGLLLISIEELQRRLTIP